MRNAYERQRIKTVVLMQNYFDRYVMLLVFSPKDLKINHKLLLYFSK